MKEIFESYKYKKERLKIENYIRYGEVYLSNPLSEMETEYYLIKEEIQKSFNDFLYQNIDEFRPLTNYEVPHFHASEKVRLFNLMFGGYSMKGRKLDFQW